MNSEENRILKAVVDNPKGLLSPADLINGIARHNRATVEKLVALGYLEEVQTTQSGISRDHYTINFYRATEKGHRKFLAPTKKIWISIKGDIRTIIISVFTALITSLIAIFINSKFGN